ncbi:MAG: phosphoglucosamine mutase [Sumerlaeia bacterium]
MKEPIVSVAGLRGIVGESFTEEIIIPYVCAFADLLETKTVVVGGDSRPSRSWAQPAVESALRARGVDVISIGLAPTPTHGMMVRRFAAGGAIAITASHNPIPWNGLKFFHEGGEFLTPDHHTRLHHSMEHPAATPHRIGTRTVQEDALDFHLKTLMDVLPPKSGARPLKVVIDCCNGASSVLAPRVAEAYGATAEPFWNDPNQVFPREAEPLPHNLVELSARVLASGADFGAAIDPDADRIAFVDETGRAIGEERSLVLGIDAYLKMSGEKTPVAVNLSTSQAIDALGRREGFDVHRTKIGEAHVLAGLRQVHAKIGGEGNGGVILPSVHPGRDAATALALILLGLQERGGTLSEWNGTIPDYALVKDKVERGNISVEESIARARTEFADADHADDTDGIKFLLSGERWVHLRPSGTEPILRIFAEAPDAAAAKALVLRAHKALA